jgi:hypothetical protein
MNEQQTKIEIPKAIVDYVKKQEYFSILYTSFEDFVLDAVRTRMLQLKKTVKPLREMQIPIALFNELSARAKKLGLSVDEYADQLLRKAMPNEVEAQCVKQ